MSFDSTNFSTYNLFNYAFEYCSCIRNSFNDYSLINQAFENYSLNRKSFNTVIADDYNSNHDNCFDSCGFKEYNFNRNSF